MDNEVDLSRYGNGLRRRRAWIALAAVIGAALGVAASTISPYQSTFTLQSVPRLAILGTAGVTDPTQFYFAGIDSVAASITGTTFESSTSAQVGTDIQLVAARPLDKADTIYVTIEAETSSGVEKAVELVTTRARLSYVEALGTTLEGVRTGVMQQKARAEERLAEIDAILTANRNGSSTLIDGLLVESQRDKSQIDQAQGLLDALDVYEKGASDDLRVLGDTTVERSQGLIKLVLAGAIGGAVLLIGLLLAMTAFDRSIRSRRDLRRLGLDTLIAVLPVGAEHLSIASTAAAVGSIASSAGVDQAQLLPASPRSSIDSWGERLRVALGDDLHLRAGLHDDPEAARAASSTALSILAVKWGADQRQDIARAANQLAAAGAKQVAVILYDVPRKEVARVED